MHREVQVAIQPRIVQRQRDWQPLVQRQKSEHLVRTRSQRRSSGCACVVYGVNYLDLMLTRWYLVAADAARSLQHSSFPLSCCSNAAAHPIGCSCQLLPPASLPPRCALPLEDTVTPAAAAADDDADARLGRRDPRSHTHSVSHDSLVSGRRHTCKLGWERGERDGGKG